MNQTIDLEKIEKKAWSSYFKDGLFDIFFALLFILSGIQLIVYNILFTLLIFAAVVVFIAGKHFISRPRLGNVKFGRKRMEKQNKARFALLGAFSVTLIIFLLGASDASGIEIDFSIILIILFIAIFGSLAYYLDFPRFLLYGIMFAAGEYNIRTYGDTAGALIFFIFGGILLIIGLMRLNLFMKRNPLPDKEVTNA